MTAYTPADRAAITRALNIIAEKGPDPAEPMTSIAASFRLLRLHYETLDTTREHFTVAFLNAQNGLIRCETLFSGTVNGSAIYPRIVAKKALETDACSVVLCHNHPSGTMTPSPEDRYITKRLQEALALLDIRVLDHLIIGPGADYYSFAEKGAL